ncbi:MAG: hypothetical protein JW741_24080 [Sedimentisphaerales bacterium]|nr:hypothetical protein [Sedimentisphaerales bacterium]
MIEKRAVFVLGAGASRPYGFPDARGLRAQIVDHFVDQWEQYTRESLSGESGKRVTFEKNRAKQDAQEFISTFDKSSTESIDLFLSRNPKLEEIGKKAICVSILGAENRSKFREQVEKPEHDWYFYLYSKLARELIGPNDFREFSKNNIVFVTFNYDRSLEHFLFTSLLHSFEDAHPDAVNEQMLRIPIIHVYGQAGGLDWQQAESKVKYGPRIGDLARVNLPEVIKDLYVVHEGRTNPALQRAREEIANAQRIFFLGFGYAKENLEALGFPDVLKRNHRIYGTAMHSTVKELQDIQRYFVHALQQGGNTSAHVDKQVTMSDCDCVALLREFL